MSNKDDVNIFFPWEESEEKKTSDVSKNVEEAVEDVFMPKLSFDLEEESSASAPKLSFDLGADVGTESEAKAEEVEEVVAEETGQMPDPARAAEDNAKAEKPEKKEKKAPVKAEKPEKKEKKAPAKAEKPEKKEKKAPVKAEKPEKKEKKAPVKAEKPEKTAQDDTSPRFLVRLIVVLTAICVFVAVLLAAVNAVTYKKIEENTLKSKTESVLSIFKGGDGCELYRTEPDGSEVYLVLRGQDIIGYCAFVGSTGFGGSIDMMVGIDSEYKTEGVSIVSMSETPGVGTKTKSDSFLSLFAGGSHGDPAGAVDAIAGATISSEAVKAGVTKAHTITVDLAAIAAERGVRLLAPGEATETSAETTAPAETSAETVAPATGAETDAPETPAVTTAEPVPETDAPYYEYRPIGGGYEYPVEGTTLDPQYNMEINREDETMTFTKETEEPEPKA